MWNQIADFAKQLFMQAQETQKNKGDIKQLQQEVKDLTATVQRLIYEVHRLGENERHEREKMALRLEIELLRSRQQLPINKPEKEPDES